MITSKIKDLIPKSVVSKLSRQALKLRKNSPQILFVAGIAGTVTSTVLACRSTLKLHETLDDVEKDIQVLDEVADEDRTSEWHRDVIWVYGKASFRVVKLYAPAVIVGSLSIVALTKSHNELTRRNTALMAAYAAISEAYENYRDRVRKEIGEERERDIYYGASKEIAVTETGSKTEIAVADPSQFSPYARIFDASCGPFEKDNEFNRLFLESTQNFCNHKLRARGHIFLNEVYDMLDFERTKAGSVVGWVIGEEGDNYVDFGIYRAYSAPFVNGYERCIILDFNVDGVIYDKI